VLANGRPRRSLGLLALASLVASVVVVSTPPLTAAAATYTITVHARGGVDPSDATSASWPMGRYGDRHLACDWNGDGRDTAVVYRASESRWYGSTDPYPAGADIVFDFGSVQPEDAVLCGDWDGDGRDGPGLYDESSGTWYLKNAPEGGSADLAFRYGRTGMGDTPLVGDWNGDGTDSPGLYRSSDNQWHLTDFVGGGPASLIYTYGQLGNGDRPLAGDWNGDGIDTPGIFRSATAEWHLRDDHLGGPAVTIFPWGRGSDSPLAGDWDADGADEPVLTREPIEAIRDASASELRSKLAAHIAGLPGDYAVTVRQLDGLGVRTSISGAGMYEPASAIKIFAAYLTLRRLETGSLSWEARTSSGTTVRDCMRVMIHISDNACHVELINLLGGGTAMNRALFAAGFTQTVYQGVSATGVTYTAKRSSTNDMALFLERLERGTLLGPSASNHLRTLLLGQLWRGGIPSGLPPGIVQGTKPGELWVSGGLVKANASVVHAPSGRIVITVLGRNGGNDAGAASIGRVVYEHFEGPQDTLMVYSKINMITTGGAMMYSRPGSGYVRTIPAGTRLEVVVSSRVWYQVNYDGTSGWVHSGLLRNRFP